MSDALNAALLERTDLDGRLAIFRIAPDAGALQAFEPGQFVQIGLPEEHPAEGARVRVTKRAYSLASGPKTPDYAELYVARVAEGRFSHRLWELRRGDRLWMDPAPKGLFVLGRVPRAVNLVLVATGTGLAPFVSMLRTWHGDERWQHATVINGVRLPHELGYRAELEERARLDPCVEYLPVVSRPPPEERWTGLTGRVQSVLEPATYQRLTGRALDPHTTHVFLCGNPDMIRDVRAQLEPLGFRPDTAREPGVLHFEKYW